MKIFFFENDPIHLSFTFGSLNTAFNEQLTDEFKKIGGRFKSRTKRFFDIRKDHLCYFKDEAKTQQLGEIKLAGTFCRIDEATDKEPVKLTLQRFDGSTFGAKVRQNERKKANRKEYVLYGTNLDQLSKWKFFLSLASFRGTIRELHDPRLQNTL
jgi:hypothetical protein